MKKTLIIFARAPRLGQGKRRLAAGVGSLAAWRFQRWALNRALRRLSRDPRWTCRLATTGGTVKLPRGLQQFPQSRGDLGQRMDQAMRGHGPGPVVLVGTDVPDIAPRHIAAAFKALDTHDAVFGPATDGGYWLVGLRGRPARPDIFSKMRWSSPDTLENSLSRFRSRFSYSLLETLTDIDDAESLARWRAQQRTLLRGA